MKRRSYPHSLLLRYRALHRRQKITIGLIVVALACIIPAVARSPFAANLGQNQAILSLVGPASAIPANQPVVIELQLTTGKQAVNTVESTIRVNPAELEIQNITTENSFCSFYAENSFDSIRGEVDLACGTPNPGFTGQSTLVVITLRPKVVGNVTIKVLPGSAHVLANDGKGTNLLEKDSSLTLSVKSAY